jgi:hypothetical protein
MPEKKTGIEDSLNAGFSFLDFVALSADRETMLSSRPD